MLNRKKQSKWIKRMNQRKKLWGANYDLMVKLKREHEKQVYDTRKAFQKLALRFLRMSPEINKWKEVSLQDVYRDIKEGKEHMCGL